MVGGRGGGVRVSVAIRAAHLRRRDFLVSVRKRRAVTHCVGRKAKDNEIEKRISGKRAELVD